MKKLLIAGTIIGVILLLGANTLIYASENPIVEPKTLTKAATSNQQLPADTSLPVSTNGSKVKFRGVWGYEGSNETKGYVGGLIIKRDRAVVLKGRWNATDNSIKGNVVGVLHNGYFNGKILIGNQTAYRIVGLYRYDQENKILHLRWMTAQQTGWAQCRIIVQ